LLPSLEDPTEQDGVAETLIFLRYQFRDLAILTEDFLGFFAASPEKGLDIILK
jgi:hypothetical protein